MPHLSPMHWLIALITTTLFTMTIMSSNWWTQQTKFSTSSQTKPKSKSSWFWQ